MKAIHPQGAACRRAVSRAQAAPSRTLCASRDVQPYTGPEASLSLLDQLQRSAAAATVAASLLLGSGTPVRAEPVAFAAEVVAEVASTSSSALLADLPKSALPELIEALVTNEQFIAQLINNEAFLDRLAGEDSVLDELQRRKSSASAAAARRELAQELVVRQQIMDELATRGPEAVVAVADTARAAIEAVDMDGSSAEGEGLLQLETAVELLEDSEELMMAAEGQGMDADVAFSGDQQFKAMEVSIAATEQALQDKIEESDMGAETLQAEREVQAAIKELFITSDTVAEDALEAVAEAEALEGEVEAEVLAATADAGGDLPLVSATFAVADAEEEEVTPAAAIATVEKDTTINAAYDHLVMAVADLQRAYKNAVGRAIGNAESKIVGVEEAALQGVEKTKALVSEKTQELERTVEVARQGVAATTSLVSEEIKVIEQTVEVVADVVAPVATAVAQDPVTKNFFVVPIMATIGFAAWQVTRGLAEKTADLNITLPGGSSSSSPPSGGGAAGGWRAALEQEEPAAPSAAKNPEGVNQLFVAPEQGREVINTPQ